jgi:hypothetical protein
MATQMKNLTTIMLVYTKIVVQNEDGVKYRRHRVKIRPTGITANIRDRSPPRSVTTEKPVNTENHERNDICI